MTDIQYIDVNQAAMVLASLEGQAAEWRTKAQELAEDSESAWRVSHDYARRAASLAQVMEDAQNSRVLGGMLVPGPD